MDKIDKIETGCLWLWLISWIVTFLLTLFLVIPLRENVKESCYQQTEIQCIGCYCNWDEKDLLCTEVENDIDCPLTKLIIVGIFALIIETILFITFLIKFLLRRSSKQYEIITDIQSEKGEVL